MLVHEEQVQVHFAGGDLGHVDARVQVVGLPDEVLVVGRKHVLVLLDQVLEEGDLVARAFDVRHSPLGLQLREVDLARKVLQEVAHVLFLELYQRAAEQVQNVEVLQLVRVVEDLGQVLAPLARGLVERLELMADPPVVAQRQLPRHVLPHFVPLVVQPIQLYNDALHRRENREKPEVNVVQFPLLGLVLYLANHEVLVELEVLEVVGRAAVLDGPAKHSALLSPEVEDLLVRVEQNVHDPVFEERLDLVLHRLVLLAALFDVLL